MAEKRSTKSTQHVLLLGAFMVMLAYYVLHTFVFTGSTSRPKATTTTETASDSPPASPGSGSIIQTPRQAQSVTSPQEKLHLLLYDLTPLDLHLIAYSRGGDAAVSKRGNIFDYHKGPPPQELPKRPPPPIAISYLQPQTAVAGTPRPFTMTVAGKGFPADAQILVNGRPRQTKRVNETTLSTEVPASEYSAQTTLAVDVKSQSDPTNFYSNQASFVVVPSPDPPFKYIGRIGEIGVLEMNGAKEVSRVTRGGTVQGVWRIESITNDGVDVIQTQYEIRKRVVMQDRAR